MTLTGVSALLGAPGGVEQKPRHLHRVAHHVVQHTAALELPVPEPRHVRPAVLLRRARQVGSARSSAAPRLQTISLPRTTPGREELVLEVAVEQADLLDQLEHPARFRGVASERLLARHTRRSSPLPDSMASDDLLHHLDPGEVGRADPECVDAGIGHHLGDRAIDLGVADAELARQAPPPLAPSPSRRLTTPSTSAFRTPTNERI